MAEEAVQRILSRAGVPPNLFDVSPINWGDDWPYKLPIIDYGNNPLQKLTDGGRSLFIHGPFSSGKSSICAWIARRIVEDRMIVRWARAQQLSQIYFERDRNSRWDSLISSPFLIIDDLAVSSQGKWSDLQIEDLVRHRIDYRLCTIISSNLDPPALVKCSPALVAAMETNYTFLEVSVWNYRRNSFYQPVIGMYKSFDFTQLPDRDNPYEYSYVPESPSKVDDSSL